MPTLVYVQSRRLETQQATSPTLRRAEVVVNVEAFGMCPSDRYGYL